MPSKQKLSRSANMARIRGRDTGPELLLRKALWRQGLRFRINLRIEGTRPDIVFPSRQLVIFLDGCFWHGCPLHYVRPGSRTEFWDKKLEANTERDRLQTRRLLESGWNVLRIWEHEVERDLSRAVEEVISAYRKPPEQFGHRSIVVKVEAGPDGGAVEHWYIEEMLGRTDRREELRTRLRKRVSA